MSGVDGASCPCDREAACRAAPAQRVWASFISPSLLLLAMCIHGVFEGLTLGIQVGRGTALPDQSTPAVQIDHEQSHICVAQRYST